MPISQHIYANSLVYFYRIQDANIAVHMDDMAEAAGDDYAATGGWGFLRNHADSATPRNNWAPNGVEPAWDGRVETWAEADIDSAMIAVSNFIQYQAPDADYAGDTRSPVEATVEIINDTHAVHPDIPIYIYEPWARLGDFSRSVADTTDDEFQAYHDHNMGAYHDWFVEFMDQLEEATPDATTILIPVAPVLHELLSGPLSDLTPSDLYTDTAPHGGETLYFLAGLISYTVVFEQQAPANYTPPDTVHPLVQELYPELAVQVVEAVERYNPELVISDGTDDPAADPIGPPADAVTATADEAQVAADETVLIDVTANDGGGRLSYVDPPLIGTARIVDGQLEYTPAAGFSGADSLTYTIEIEPGVYEEAEVRIQVGGGAADGDPVIPDPVQDPDPVADPVDPDNLVAAPGAALTIDPQTVGAGTGEVLFYVDPAGQGSTAIEDGLLIYTPDADAAGTDSLSFSTRAEDGTFVEYVLDVSIREEAPAEDPVVPADLAPAGPTEAPEEPAGGGESWLDALTQVQTSDLTITLAGDYVFDVAAAEGFTLTLDDVPIMGSPAGSVAETVSLDAGTYQMAIATPDAAPATVTFNGPAPATNVATGARASVDSDGLPWVQIDDGQPVAEPDEEDADVLF